jgi:hypothetical protein
MKSTPPLTVVPHSHDLAALIDPAERAKRELALGNPRECAGKTTILRPLEFNGQDVSDHC